MKENGDGLGQAASIVPKVCKPQRLDELIAVFVSRGMPESSARTAIISAFQDAGVGHVINHAAQSAEK